MLQVGLLVADNNWVRTAIAWLLSLLAMAVGTVIFLGAVKGFDHLYQGSRTRAWLSLTAVLALHSGTSGDLRLSLWLSGVLTEWGRTDVPIMGGSRGAAPGSIRFGFVRLIVCVPGLVLRGFTSAIL